MKDPKKVANLVIKAIRNADLDLIVSLFNLANRQKFLPINDKKGATLMQLREVELPKIADVKEVEEIREIAYGGVVAVIAKVRQIGDDVHGIILTKEGDDYFFEDFHHPSVAQYNRLKLLE